MVDNFQKQDNTSTTPDLNDIQGKFLSALGVIDDIVLKNYVTKLADMDIVPLDDIDLSENLGDNVQLFKITEMVYEKNELATLKFATVFNSMPTGNCSIFIFMDSDGEKTDFYLGIRGFDNERTTASLKNTLQKALVGQFPGVKTKDVSGKEKVALVNRVRTKSITAVTTVANSKDRDIKDNSAFIQGLEKLALSMQGEKYTAIVIANGTSKKQLDELRRSYETVYTQLSPFANAQVSYADTTSLGLSEAISQGSSVGTTHTLSITNTEGISATDGEGISVSETKESLGSKSAKGVATAASILGIALAVPTGGTSLIVGGAVAAGAGLLGQLIQKTNTHAVSLNSSISKSSSVAEGENIGNAITNSEGKTDTKSIQTGTSHNLTLTIQDKTISNVLERIELQINRLKEFESLGAWECAAYFMSGDQHTAEIAASTYKALMRGEDSGVEVSAINSWHDSIDKNKNKQLRDYITNFVHPVFSYRSANPFKVIEVTPCSFVSSNELALQMGLPRKSVCGFPVIEHATLGQEVVSYNHIQKANGGNFSKKDSCSRQCDSIRLGNIFNMGSISTSQVKLDLESLSMHTFITGSTGSGKSNAVYEVLRQLEYHKVNFLVIEPTKGDYKKVFGACDGTACFGTNPKFGEILRINPFKFPANIHVLEHIDRLVEIFNVCWPMYAAMPAVLKNAILQAYEVCGWDLVESDNINSNDLFPTFSDLLSELTDVIENSAYSQELKSNYQGALSTRVRSLTNGLNGLIFSTNEVDNQVLFDSNVIVDLSRVGSLETKSLIMGILVMRLSEYRMSSTDTMNEPLKHVTVIEEAHNILKRTNTDQNMESPSITGKSVEMLSNTIAEMRSYGEGIIIVDQSPSAVDMSAIRNTNTKLILRLPDEIDRRVAGKSAAMNEEQLDEIAKLPRGVAVVYQNDWVEPVLCIMSEYKPSDGKAQWTPRVSSNQKVSEAKYRAELLKLLLMKRSPEAIEVDLDYLMDNLDVVRLSTKNKIGIRRLLNEYQRTGILQLWEQKNFESLSEMVSELVDAFNTLRSSIWLISDLDSLTIKMCRIIDKSIPGLTDSFRVSVCQCLLRNLVKESKDNKEIYAAWVDKITKIEGF